MKHTATPEQARALLKLERALAKTTTRIAEVDEALGFEQPKNEHYIDYLDGIAESLRNMVANRFGLPVVNGNYIKIVELASGSAPEPHQPLHAYQGVLAPASYFNRLREERAYKQRCRCGLDGAEGWTIDGEPVTKKQQPVVIEVTILSDGKITTADLEQLKSKLTEAILQARRSATQAHNTRNNEQ
ncbi:MAG: hypothetical protein ACK5JD_01680 [Mangrovibacterium sp.]